MTRTGQDVTRLGMSDLSFANGVDHVGVVGADLDALARAFQELGFRLTPMAAHAGGRTANRCAMLRDGGYLELMATVPGHDSATLDRFLARGPGAHILALDIADEAAVLARLNRAGIKAEPSVTERDAGGAIARFGLIMPPDMPEGRVLLIHHHTRSLLWRPGFVTHPNGALALTEAVYGAAIPAATMTHLSRIAGRPAEPDPLGGYRIPLARGCIRVLPREAAEELFPGAAGNAPIVGLTIATAVPEDRVVHAAGVAIRFTTAPG